MRGQEVGYRAGQRHQSEAGPRRGQATDQLPGRALHKRPARAPCRAPVTAVSVVVPTVGKPTVIDVLDALARQTAGSPPFEVIVVVDGGHAPNLSNAARHPACQRVEVIRLPHPAGVSAARNEGARVARAPLVGFLDDDVTPDPGWVAAVARDLTEWTAITGRIVEDVAGSTLGELRRLAFDHRHAVVTARPALAVDFLNGGNCAVRADALREVGGFDTSFRKSQDRELARRLLHAGRIIGYAPDVVVRHHSQYTWRGLWRGRYAAGLANRRLLTDGDTTAVGPSSATDTYGHTLPALLRAHGLKLAAAAALAVLAERAGRRRALR